MTNKIILFKTVDGAEVIGRLKDHDANAMVIEKPRVLSIQPMNGQVSVAMIPFFIGSPDDDAMIYLDKVIGEPQNELPKELEDGYIQQTSNIQIAGAGGIQT